MRLTDEQLKTGFLHPSQIVRDSVADYFGDSFSRDPDVTRWAIRGVEEFGWGKFLAWPHKFCELPLLNEDSFDWVCRQLDRDDAKAPSQNQRRHLSSMLAKADANFLKSQQSRLLSMDHFDANRREAIVQRVELLDADPEDCWRKLEEHCHRVAKVDEFEKAKIPEATRLLEPLIRAGDRFAPRVLEVLRRPQPKPGSYHPDDWLIGLSMILAGHLRLEEAAPLIFDRFAVDWDWYSEEAMYALKRIGTPSVVQLTRERFADSAWHVRLYAHNVFECIRCEESLLAVEALVPGEEDHTLRSELGVAAAKQFDERGARLALELLNEDPHDVERQAMHEPLVAFSYLSGWDLPQRDLWERRIDSENRGLEQDSPSLQRLVDRLTKFANLSPRLLPPTFRTDLPSDMDDLTSVPSDSRAHFSPRVGRNDPCPCGSGKKYKKCCLTAHAKLSR